MNRSALGFGGAILGYASGEDTGDSLLNAGILATAGFNFDAVSGPVKVATLKAKDNRAKYTFANVKHQAIENDDINYVQQKLSRLSKKFNRIGQDRTNYMVHNLEVMGINKQLGLNDFETANDFGFKMRAQIANLQSNLADPQKFDIAEKLIKTSAFSSRITMNTFAVGQRYTPRVAGQAIDGNIESALTKRFSEFHGMEPKEASRVAKSLSSFLGQGEFSNVFMTEFGLKFGQGRNERHLPIPFVERLRGGGEGALYLKSGGKTHTSVVPRFNPFGDMYSKGQSFQLGQKMYGQTTLDMLRTGYQQPEMLGFMNALGKMKGVTDFDIAMEEMNKSRQYIAGNYDIAATGSTARARQVSGTIKLNKALSFDREGNMQMRNMMPIEMADILTRAGNEDRSINLLANLPKSEVLGISANPNDYNPLGTPFFEASRQELAYSRDTYSVQSRSQKPEWLRRMPGQESQDFVNEQTFGTKRLVTDAEAKFLSHFAGSGVQFGDGQGIAFGSEASKITSATDISIKIPLADDGSVNGLSDIFSNLEDIKKIQSIKAGEVIAQTEAGAISLGQQYSHAKIKGYRIVDKDLILDAAAFANPEKSGYQKVFSSDTKLGLQVLSGETEQKVKNLMAMMADGRIRVLNEMEAEFEGQTFSAKDLSKSLKLTGQRLDYGANILSNSDNAGLEDYVGYVEKGQHDLAKKSIVEQITSRSKASSQMYLTLMNRLGQEDQGQLQYAVNNIIGKPEDVQTNSMSTIEGLVEKTFKTREDFLNIDVAYRAGHLQGITGAGGNSTGGMSRLHFKSLMESSFGADKGMATQIIDSLTSTNKGAMYEIDMLRQQVKPGTIASEDSEVMRRIFEAGSEDRLAQVEGAFGSEVAEGVKNNNMLLNYSLSREYNGLRSVSVPMIDTSLSGINEFGVDVPTMKSLDKSRLEVIMADIDAKMEQNADLRKFKFEKASEAADKYSTLLRNRFGGDGVAKQSLSRTNKFGGIKTARIAGGEFEQFVESSRQAGKGDSIVGISQSQLREYSAEVAEQSGGTKELIREQKKGISTVMLRDKATDVTAPYQVHISREPAQGIGSFGAFSVAVDDSLDNIGKAANVFFSEDNPLARTGSMDVDGDILSVLHTASLDQDQRMYYEASMRENRAILDRQDVRGVGKGLGKGAKDKVKLTGVDYPSQEAYIAESFIESRKARLHKIAAPDVTKVNFVLSDALSRFGSDANPEVKSMANILNYQLTETMLKTKHMSNEQFLSMQKGSVEAIEGAMSEVQRTMGRNPTSVNRLRDVISSQLLPDTERMGKVSGGAPGLFDEAVQMVAKSYASAQASRVMDEIGSTRDISRSKNISELADSVLKYSTSQGHAGASSGLVLDTSIIRSANDAPVETAKNIFYQISDIISENLKRNKGIASIAVAGLAAQALLSRTQPTFEIDAEPTAHQSTTDVSARAMPVAGKSAPDMKPIQSQTAYVRKFSDREVNVNVSKAGNINKQFDQAYNGNGMGDVNMIIKNG